MKDLKKTVSFFVILCFLTSFSVLLVSAPKATNQKKLININTAGVDLLAKLPNVGKKTAEKIIEFRKKHGKFKKVQDLMKVKGIGEKKFQKIRKKITV